MVDYCLVFRMSDNAGAQPWPARSLVCVSMAVKYTPNDMRGSTVQSMMDVQPLSMEGSGTFLRRIIKIQPKVANNWKLVIMVF